MNFHLEGGRTHDMHRQHPLGAFAVPTIEDGGLQPRGGIPLASWRTQQESLTPTLCLAGRFTRERSRFFRERFAVVLRCLVSQLYQVLIAQGCNTI